VISLSDSSFETHGIHHEHPKNGIAVSMAHVGLTYTTSIEKRPTLKKRLTSLGRGRKYTRVVKALNDVSLDVHYGTVLGVIGSNGAGKSSLMRVISGIVPPSQGRVEVYGSVSTLLALGVGFNPSLTGRANVYLGGLAAGMSRAQIDRQFDEIADFSELGDAIDVPMRTYSSGMFARLAFSVAATVKPDILIVDEALSTGDAKFKEKSLNRIKELRTDDRALILVSHAMATIADVCNEVVWLHKGAVMMRGEPTATIKAYQDFMQVRKSAASDEDV
jgi:ABC-type polysaccharide/polyol phosphate transport system ATPase subunit